MTEVHSIELRVEETQEQALLKQYDQFVYNLERGRPLEPALVAELRTQMQAILTAQPGYAESAADAERNQHRILRLEHNTNRLLNLPWRLAVDHLPFLYLTKGLKQAPSPNAAALRNPLPLKVLVMIAAPEGGGARLSYEEEEDQIIRAFEPLYAHGKVQIDFTEDGSLDSLQRKLRENHYHILHFSGHGTFRNGSGYLQLEDEVRMEPVEVSAHDFAAALNAKPEHLPALVLLSSCQTAQGTTTDTFRGVVNKLLEVGVPAVVAMGLSVLDYFATVFAGALYQEIATEEPLHRAFRAAVGKTRQEEQRLRPQQPPGQWMIPQLYTSGDLGRLLDWKAPYEPLQFQNLKFITGDHALLLERHAGYQFLGRRRERKQALRPLIEHQPVLLRGQGGVGKTALAEHLVQRLSLRNGRLQPFAFDETTDGLNGILEALKNYLRTEHQRWLIDSEVKTYDKALEQFLFLFQEIGQVCDPLFVFDNLESFQTEPGGLFAEPYADLKEVIAFFYSNRPCPLLLTGRYPLADFPEVVTIDLNQVRFADFWRKCQQLSISALQQKQSLASKKAGSQTFRQVAEQLHAALGGNYRALELFDRLYREQQAEALRTLDTLADYLDRYQDALLIEMSENLVFTQLLDLLTPEEKTVLGLAAQFRLPLLPLAIELQPATPPEPAAALNRLTELTLLERHRDPIGEDHHLDYYYCPPLVRTLLDQVDFSLPDLSDRKAGDYYYFVDKNINLRTYDELREAFAHYHRAEVRDKVAEIGERLADFFYGASLYRQSLWYAKQTEELLEDDTPAPILNRLGMIYNLYGNYDQALTCYQRCLPIQQEIGDRAGEGTTLNNISQIYDARGDYATALRYLEQSLAIQQEIGDRAGEGTTLNNMAKTAHARGDYATALRYLEQSLAIRQEIGDRSGEGTTLNNISQIYKARGDYATALRYLEQSLAIRQEIGDRSGEGTTLNNISQIYQAREDYATALRYLEQSLAIQQEIGDRAGEGATLNNISLIYDARGDYATALRYLEQSLAIRQEIGDRSGEGTTLNNISQIYDARGDYATALRYLEQSLAIQQEIGDRAGMCATLHNMAQIAWQDENVELYMKYEVQGYQIARETGNALALYHIGYDLGTMLCNNGAVAEGLPLLQQAHVVAEQSGLPNAEKIAALIEKFSSQS